MHHLQTGSECSSASNLQEQPPLDADELHSTLLAKATERNERENAPPQLKWRTFKQWAIDSWFWEMALLVMSMGAFSAEAGILWTYSGRSLPDWPTGLTLNALISLLSAISTSGLLSVISSIIGQNKWIWLSRDTARLSHIELIDDASRGPWGSLIFLAATRTLNPISLASIISICSLLTAPFVQQVIQVKYMTLAINSTLTPDRVLYHNQVGGYFTNYVGYIDVPGVLISSMDQGISFNRDLNDPLSRNFLQLIPSCPTGNCSFDVHDSLAVCSECADLSSLLEVQQNYTPPNQIVFYNYTSTDEHNNTILKSANWTTEYASNRMNWTLPNGFSHSIWVNLDPDSEYTTRMYYETSEYYEPLKVKVDFPIANITIVLPSVDDQAFASLANAKAQECLLYWCVNRYRSQIIHGYLFEEVLDSSRSGRLITSPNLNYKQDNVYYELSAPGSSLFSSTNPEPSQWLNGTTDRFIVGRELSTELSGWAGSLLGGPSMMDTRLNSRNYNLQADFSQTSMISKESTPQSRQSSVDDVFEAVALSMTTALRSHNQPDGVDWGLKFTPGEITTIAAVLKIRWVWLTLPASLQLGTLILLLHSRLNRSRKTIPVWKSSALSAVFFGSKGVQDLDDRNATKLVEMKELASGVRTSGFFIEKGRC